MQEYVSLNTNLALPVLEQTGVLVVDGSLAGCVLAWELAQRGRRVTLVTPATSLPTDVVVARRPWHHPEQLATLPTEFARVWRSCRMFTDAHAQEVVNLAKLAIAVEDLLLDAGVRVRYGLTPCGVEQTPDGQLAGVVLGGKAGLLLLRAQQVLDCTPHATVAALAGVPLQVRKPGATVQVAFSAKVGIGDAPGPVKSMRGQASADRISPPDLATLSAEHLPELVSSTITLHGPYADIPLQLPCDLADPCWRARLSAAARLALVRVGEAITTARLAADQPGLYFYRFPDVLLTEPLWRCSTTGPCPNLWLGSWIALSDIAKWSDPYALVAALAALPDTIATTTARHVAPGALRFSPANTDHHAASNLGSLRCADVPSLHHIGSTPWREPLTLPVLASSSVLVAGGGTAGVPAALAAARQGAQTVLVEQHSDLGGVRTVGGVGSYWFGRSTDFQQQCDEHYDALTARSGVAEEVGMLHALQDAGTCVLAGYPLVGTLLRERQVAGVVLATERGLGVVRGAMVIDSTGDADVAAWAGAPFDYGTGRDAWTMWASFANFNAVKRTANRQYESALEPRDPLDLTRSIVRGRRRQGMWTRLDHEMPQHYVAPRESRRLRASATVTYSGILAGETFPDAMTICESNFDIKGIASSHLLACGVVWSWDVHTKYRVAIPYRAVLPEGLDNVLIACRAYSASHDALALARMQRDMVNLGGAAGVVAAAALTQRQTPAELNVAALQKQWRELGMIRPEDQKQFTKPAPANLDRQIQRDLRWVQTGRAGWPSAAARLVRTEQARQPLRDALAACTRPTGRLRLARLLGYLGDAMAAPVLLQSIEEQIAKDLPDVPVKCLAVPPEHGWAPDPVYSLHALSFMGPRPELAPLLAKLASKIQDREARYASTTESQFEYVLAIAAAAERCAGPELIKPLEYLLQRRSLTNQDLPAGRDPRFAVDPVAERRAYLELCIGRALARCGDERGYHILLRYCDDLRAALARSAQDELTELLGAPLPENWRDGLVGLAEAARRVQPCVRRLD